MKKTKPLQGWRITVIRHKGERLGAVEEFGITNRSARSGYWRPASNEAHDHPRRADHP